MEKVWSISGKRKNTYERCGELGREERDAYLVTIKMLSTRDLGDAKPFWLNGKGSHWEDLGLDKMNNIERIWSKGIINLFLNIGHLFIYSFSENIDWDKEKW